jgi:protein TonB
MNRRIAFLFWLASAALHAQELIQTDYEKGYVKDRKRYSVWQYFNSNKEVELVINHTTGKVMYVIPDTSNYVILKDGEWITSKLDVHPIPTNGFHNFYQAILNTLKYPYKGLRLGLEGRVFVSFDVDTTGATTNYRILKSIGSAFDSTILASCKATEPRWVPARVGKKRYPARFATWFEFRFDQTPLKHENFALDPKMAKLLKEFIVQNPIDWRTGAVYSFVDQTAEPVHGLPEFFEWVGKNLRYPITSRRIGREGKVFVKFIIEPNGKITNAEVVKGLNEECNQEALRLISSSPDWKPGTQNGRPVRQAYTLPIIFKLTE